MASRRWRRRSGRRDDAGRTYPLGIFIAGFRLIHRSAHSPFGQVPTTVRENELRALLLGDDTDRFKLLAWVLSAGLASLAGATKTRVLGFSTLTTRYGPGRARSSRGP